MVPLVRLMVRFGVTYPVFLAQVKLVFLQAAEDELISNGAAITSSAVSLLSGVHRRDVRTLSPAARGIARQVMPRSMGLATEVIAGWRHLHGNERGETPKLARVDFDALVHRITRDVRPRSVLDELKRLGAAEEFDDGLLLSGDSFAPTQRFEEMTEFFSSNLCDHASAAAQNLMGGSEFLEQAVFVDEITEQSARAVRDAAVEAWKLGRRSVMSTIQARFASDSANVPSAERRHRARFGVYFFSASEAAR